MNVMKKDICAMLIAAATVVAVLPAGAVKIPSWRNLQERFNIGGVITLSHDLSAAQGGEGPLTVTTTVTLDLAGHTLEPEIVAHLFRLYKQLTTASR